MIYFPDNFDKIEFFHLSFLAPSVAKFLSGGATLFFFLRYFMITYIYLSTLEIMMEMIQI